MIDKEIASLDNFKKNFSEEAYQYSEFGIYTGGSGLPSMTGSVSLESVNYGIEGRCMCGQCINARSYDTQPQVNYSITNDPNIWNTSIQPVQYNPNPWVQIDQAYQNAVVYGSSTVAITPTTTYTRTDGLPE